MQSLAIAKNIFELLVFPFKIGKAIFEFAKNKLKGGGRNNGIWSDEYPMPNWDKVDWTKTDEQLAQEITKQETQKGAGTAYNKIRKYIQQKRREHKNKKSKP